MAMDKNNGLDDQQARLETLRTNYLERLPQRLDKLEYLAETLPIAQSCLEDTSDLRSRLNTLYQEAHKLAGSAGSVGLHSVSYAAKLILDMVDTWFSASSPDPDYRQSEMLRLIQTMRTMEAEDSQPIDIRAHHDSRKIHVVEDNELAANEMLSWLRGAGFDAQVFMSATIYADTFEILPQPDLIIIDIHFGDERDAGPRIIEFLKQKFGRLPPVAFLSVRDDMDARLAALRAGAARYLTKPIMQQALIDLAHEFAARTDAPAFRVFMVDDDETTLKVNQLVLEQAGLDVCAVSAPMEALDAAREFGPDLILLDVIMPEVSGHELAAVLRQDRQFDPIPILFLTADTHPDQKVLGAALGGDDYINKPFDPDYLLTTVFARARRARRLRELLQQPRTS